jgi:ubiquinone/menaquinone biosynthesis C-methylase UbiE
MKDETEVREFYNKIAWNYEAEHQNRLADNILEYFILGNIPQNRKLKILDLGSGIGRFAKPLLERGNEVSLVDISENMLRKSKDRLDKFPYASFHIASGIDLSLFEDNSFDVVLIMNAVLGYCGDYQTALNNINRVLKNGGLLIGNVNNRFIYCQRRELKEGNYELFKNNMYSGDRYISWGGYNKGHISHEFTLDELKYGLINSSFQIIKILGVFNLMDKYDLEHVKNKEIFLQIQIEYAEKEEYINNSQDYFFVARKFIT